MNVFPHRSLTHMERPEFLAKLHDEGFVEVGVLEELEVELG
jgi:hypothetical protein